MLIDAFAKAKKEGRICSSCGWIVTKKYWKRGQRLCWGCLDALRGVNVPYGHWQPHQEPADKTGEMI